MGQVSSLTWCCCDRDRRASVVLNDALQVKLLNEPEHTETTNIFDDSPASIDGERRSRKQSSPRGARVASGMMSLAVESEDDDGSDGRTSRDRLDEEDDDGDDDDIPHGGKITQIDKRRMSQLGTSYRSSTNAWDLTRDSVFGIDSVPTELGILPSESNLLAETRGGESIQKLDRQTSDMSARDSYASSREIMETTYEDEDDDGDDDLGQDAAADKAILRRRSMPRPSSSRVFDDDLDASRMSSQSSTARGLRELADHDEESDELNSYGSASSSMQSFLTRHSDVHSTDTPLVELTNATSTAEGDREAVKEPTLDEQSSRNSGHKKKGKKRR